MAGNKGGRAPRGARQALMALRDLLAWQGRLIEEALRDIDEPRPDPCGGKGHPPVRQRGK